MIQQIMTQLGKLIDNRRIVYALTVAEGYIAHFNPKWLFVTGDSNNNRHNAPRMGLLYIFLLPFILIGIYQLIFGKYDKKIKYFVFAWFLIAPIPASITTEVPHAVRTMNSVPMYAIFAAVGLMASWLHIHSYTLINKNSVWTKISTIWIIYLFRNI